MQNSQIAERSRIFGRPGKRPYGARLSFQMLGLGAIGDIENVSILLDSGACAVLATEPQAPWETGKRLSLSLHGFSTATLAEQHGLRLACSLLWTAVSMGFGIKLNYETHEPCAVFERFRSRGPSELGYGRVVRPPSDFIDQLTKGYSAIDNADRGLLLSMEIFCAASLEASDRAGFLAVVSALEPLAVAQSLGSEVSSYIEDCLKSLDANPSLELYRDSLRGRIQELRQESIRQALRRSIREKLPREDSAWQIIDAAYGLRSQLIHKGRPDDPDIDLAIELRKVAAVIRKLYASELGLSLTTQPC